MVWKMCDHDGTRRDGVYELQGEELSCPYKLLVVPVDEIEGKDSEEIRAKKMYGEVGVGVADEV